MSKWIGMLALLLCIVALPVAAQDATEVTPEATVSAADLPDVVRSVYDQLIAQPGLAAEVVTPLSVEKTEFPDGCLGAPTADEMCAMMITEGYRTIFDTPFGPLEVRTSLTGDNFRIAAPLALPANTLPALMYEISGGIAGICNRLVVGPDGSYALTNCRTQDEPVVVSTGTLPEPDKTALADALTTYAPFKWPMTLVPPAPDQFVTSYVLNGSGKTEIDEQGANDLDARWMTLIGQILASASPLLSSTEPANNDQCSIEPVATPCATLAVSG